MAASTRIRPKIACISWHSYGANSIVLALMEINYPISDYNGCTVEVSEGINNSIPHFIMDMIAYPLLE